MASLSELQEARMVALEEAVNKMEQYQSNFVSNTAISRLDLLLQTQIKDLVERVDRIERLVARIYQQP